MTDEAPVTLVTGTARSALARRLLRTLATRAPRRALRALVPAAEQEAARAWLDAAGLGDRVALLLGDPWRIDLGLTGAEWTELAERVAVVHHVPAEPGREDAGAAPAVHPDAARELLELAGAAPELERLVLWSSVTVSGRREGRVLEGDLDARAGFHHPRDRGLFEAEGIFRRAMPRHAITVLRPGVLAWSAGEEDAGDGGLASLLVRLLLEAPPELRLPLPGHGATPLHIVPVDYVVDGGLALADAPEAAGSTFHLIDGAAPGAREFYERVAGAAGRPRPRGFVPASLAKALRRHPLLQRLDRPTQGALDQLATDVTYDDDAARALLAPRGIDCPPLERWIADLVARVRADMAVDEGP